MKFCVDIICQIETCQTIQSYSPGGATLPDRFASFGNPAVAVTTAVASSAVFSPNWVGMRLKMRGQLIRHIGKYVIVTPLSTIIMDFSRGNIKFVRDQTVLSDLT